MSDSISVPDKNPLAEGAPNQADVAWQLARPDEYSCHGLKAFTIAGICVITLAVVLRMWSRRISKATFTADDWTIVVAWFLTVCAQSVYLANNYNTRLCFHTYTLSRHDVELQGKLWYTWNLFYTTGYPIARISLCLLYMRVFVKRWFRIACWIMIGFFAGYLFGSFWADVFQAIPFAANWDMSVKMRHTTNRRALFLANAGFNVATDAILLVLPLAVIWQLKMNWPQKLGISVVFLLGGLTVIASIFRLQSYLAYQGNDPNSEFETSYSLQADPQWWTLAELDLGILCPCLVVFGPLVRTTYRSFSTRLSVLSRWTGSGSRTKVATDSLSKEKSLHFENQRDFGSTAHSLHSKPSDLEAGVYHFNESAPAVPLSNLSASDRLSRDQSGMAVNQGAALANLDPRAGATDAGGRDPMPMGTSASAAHGGYVPNGTAVPGHKIGISQEFKLERE